MLKGLHTLEQSKQVEKVFIDDIDIDSKYHDLKQRCKNRNTFFIHYMDEPYMVYSKNNYLTIAPVSKLRQKMSSEKNTKH